MIRFWMRELGGWLLVGIGLFLFYVCLGTLLHPQPGIFEGSMISVIGIIVFRGGIHLLKVSVAARVCLQTQAELSKRQEPAPPHKQKPETPWDW